MSSTVTDEFANGRKLVVQVAENGHTVELVVDCDGSTTVEEVQRCLETLSGIRCIDQLLLCLDMRLEPQQCLSSYKLPGDGECEVFLYNRSRLVQDSPLPELEQIEIPDVLQPPSPTKSHAPHPLDESLDPARKALPSYERQFRYHFQCGHAIYTCTERKFQLCERLLREQRVQDRAFETARRSMNHFYQMVHQMYTDFIKCYAQQHRYLSNLLQSFDKDLDKLRSCKLHPSLQTESRKCLLDLVKEETVHKFFETCSSNHRQFELKVSQFKVDFVNLKRRVEDLFSCKASASIRDTELAIKDNQRYLNEQRIIMQSLSKDVNTVKKLVDDCLNSQLSASLRPHDAVSALGPMYDVHDKNHLPKMQACDRMISKVLEFCKAKKNEMNLFVHNGMQKVALIQHLGKELRLQYIALKEAMGRHDSNIGNLELVRKIGCSYRACLAEVVRRKEYMKLYMGMAGQLAEKLATKRQAEVRRREDFHKNQKGCMPDEILAAMGLFDSPKHCDVHVAPFDTNLLDIDIMDVDHYAPGTLLGLSEKTFIRSSSAVSHESTNLAETEENCTINIEKWDANDVLDGCISVEIAGTSKLEVENARLKAELAAAIVQLCSFRPDFDYKSLDDSKLDNLLKINVEKTSEALQLKDEYAKHLESMLKMKQMQCESYEKRIQELEQRLSDQYMHGQKLLCGKDASGSNLLTVKADDCKSDISGDGEAHMPYFATEAMDEVSCSSASLHQKVEQFERQMVKPQEGIDENMAESCGLLNQLSAHSARNSVDSLMLEQTQGDVRVEDQGNEEKIPLGMLPCGTTEEPSLPSKALDALVMELKQALEDKSNWCCETEAKLRAALEEASTLRRELEISRKLLDESQMNCAHLENCLHEAREEAHTNLCAADRRASEYSALRASAVKMRGLFERFRSCVTATGGPAGFAELLRSLAASLTSSLSENEDDGTVEFQACIKVLADKVGALSRQRADLIALTTRLNKELEEKKELAKSLYAKHQLEKQVNKEKISFGRFELHELAAFILNSAGHYEAINRNFSNYYLSAESVALFMDNLPIRPTYIIGQIVHIERKTVKPPASHHGGGSGDQVGSLSSKLTNTRSGYGQGFAWNPYDLPIGCEYYVVTVAMLPDTIRSATS